MPRRPIMPLIFWSTSVQMAMPYAVDVSSGVETEPGQKDWAKVRAFVARARGAAGAEG